jgi:hypothetical protein
MDLKETLAYMGDDGRSFGKYEIKEER